MLPCEYLHGHVKVQLVTPESFPAHALTSKYYLFHFVALHPLYRGCKKDTT
jgi:hypothetical protein